MLQSLLEIADALLLENGIIRTREAGLTFYVRPDAALAHSAHQEFLRSFEDDVDLKVLLTGDPASVGVPRDYTPRKGLAAYLLNAAAFAARVSGDLSLDSLSLHLRQSVDDLRRLVRKGSLRGHQYVFFNLTLPEGTVLDTPWGILRCREARDDLLTRQFDDHSPKFEGGSVLEASFKFKWVLKPDGTQLSDNCVVLRDERWYPLMLAALLTLGPNNPLAVVPWFTTNFCSILESPPTAAMKAELVYHPEIKKAQVPGFESWIEAVHEARLRDIAVRRTFSLFERHGAPVDAFIDAVIVWEALFGTGDTNELAYRVSMNMASVIGSDPTSRMQIQRDVKKLYHTRSQVVHGGRHISQGEGLELSRRSRELTILAWQRLLVAYPGLLKADAAQFVEFILTNAGGSPDAPVAL